MFIGLIYIHGKKFKLIDSQVFLQDVNL